MDKNNKEEAIKLARYIVLRYKLGTPVRHKRCQHIKKSKLKFKKGEQCKLPVIIGDYCHRHCDKKGRKK